MRGQAISGRMLTLANVTGVLLGPGVSVHPLRCICTLFPPRAASCQGSAPVLHALWSTQVPRSAGTPVLKELGGDPKWSSRDERRWGMRHPTTAWAPWRPAPRCPVLSPPMTTSFHRQDSLSKVSNSLRTPFLPPGLVRAAPPLPHPLGPLGRGLSAQPAFCGTAEGDRTFLRARHHALPIF